MKATEKFEMLAEMASLEKGPEVDVARRVVEILAARRGQAIVSDKPLMWVAAISFVFFFKC